MKRFCLSIFISLIAIVAMPGRAWASIAHVQTSALSVNGNSTSAVTSAFASNISAGDTVVVCIATSGTSITPTVTGIVGDTFVQAGSYGISGNFRASVWYVLSSVGGACTISVTPNATSFVSFVAVEYSGVASLDSSANSNGTSTTPTTGSITVSQAGDLLVGAIKTTTTQNGFASQNRAFACNLSSGSEQFICVDDFSGVSAALGATWPTSGAWGAAGASFKATSTPSGGTKRRPW